MNIFISFKTIFFAMIEMVVFALIGLLMMRLKVIKEEGLEDLSRLVISVTLPLFIFQRLISGFSFRLYSNWWVFPLMSLGITALGLTLGLIFIKLFNLNRRREFLSLVIFQNAGYLPLAISSVLLPAYQAQVMFIYIFLFLLGFNLLIWSLGMGLLSKSADFKDKNNLKALFSPPVIATIISLLAVFLSLNRFIPEVLTKPLKTVGEMTIPLSLIVLGGNLSEVNIKNVINRESLIVALAKLFIMPALVLIFLKIVALPRLMGLLLILQAAVPSATSLAVISRKLALEDKLISSTILLTHLVCIVTLPVFILLYELVLS